MQNACMLYKHAFMSKYITVPAFRIYVLHDEDATKRGGWRPCIE